MDIAPKRAISTKALYGWTKDGKLIMGEIDPKPVKVGRPGAAALVTFLAISAVIIGMTLTVSWLVAG